MYHRFTGDLLAEGRAGHQSENQKIRDSENGAPGSGSPGPDSVGRARAPCPAAIPAPEKDPVPPEPAPEKSLGSFGA